MFVLALCVFEVGSALCGLADSFAMLVATRVLQGFGGAMMTPVGRLILLRSFPRSELVRAMTYVTVPAILGPVIGPLLGGVLTTVCLLALDFLRQFAVRLRRHPAGAAFHGRRAGPTRRSGSTFRAS